MPPSTETERLGAVHKVTTAFQLSKQMYSNRRLLSEELPNVARNYSNPITAYRRLGYVADLARRGELRSNLVPSVVNRHKTHGMASVQRLAPGVGRDGFVIGDGSVEVSYWHGDLVRGIAIKTGLTTVRTMAKAAIEFYCDVDEHDPMWMVTLPDDEIKGLVCEGVGMEEAGSPRRFDIDDGVTRDRQLWVGNIGGIAFS